jgi:phage terminase large subunit-like protein
VAPDPSATLGYAGVAWIEHYLPHGPGDVQGDPIELDAELIEFIAEAYRVDEHGRRCYDEAFFSRSKGRAKSELAGMLVCFEFVGPARFDHWAVAGETMTCASCAEVLYVYDEGDPVGAPITYPFIRCMATEEGQSGNTYDNVSYMLEQLLEQHPDDFPGIDIGNKAATSTRVFLQGGGEIRPSTASNASKDGGKETFTVYDETHLYITPALRGMYSTVRRNALKRKIAQPWLLQTSTMYGKGEDSVAEQTHKAHTKGAARKLLFDHVEAPEGLDPENRADRVKGLAHCYGPFHVVMPLEDIADEYTDPRTETSDWLRYFWNRASAGSADLVDAHRWASLAVDDEDQALKPRDQIALGFDGSRSDDSTALIAVRLTDLFAVPIKIWSRPPRAAEDWRVDRGDVDAVMTDTYSAYRVTMCFADPNKWEPYLDLWEARWPKRIAEEWPGVQRTDRNVRLLRAHIKDGSLNHNGDVELAKHMHNAAIVKGRLKPAAEVDEDDDLAKYYLGIKKKGAGKIDAAFALMLAVAAAGWSIEHGARTTRRTFWGAAA